MGKAGLMAVIDHCDLDLVALYVYSDRKAGRDDDQIAKRESIPEWPPPRI